MEPVKILSPQQTIIMQHLVNGLTAKEAALSMKICRSTVRKHLEKARNKLGARTRDQAIAFVVASGEIQVRLNEKDMTTF